jgi:hypothetical protein
MSKNSKFRSQDMDRVDRTIKRWRGHRIISIFILVGIVVIAVASFTEAGGRLISAVKPLFQAREVVTRIGEPISPQPSIPALPSNKTCAPIGRYEFRLRVPPGGSIKVETGYNSGWEQQVLIQEWGKNESLLSGAGPKSWASPINYSGSDVFYRFIAEHKNDGKRDGNTPWVPSSVGVEGLISAPVGRYLRIGWEDGGFDAMDYNDATANIWPMGFEIQWPP